MGMGLAISRSIVEQHGGRLWAGPGRETGSIFCFELPAARDRREVPAEPSRASDLVH
jgi:signal transduction histidine kinase